MVQYTGLDIMQTAFDTKQVTAFLQNDPSGGDYSVLLLLLYDSISAVPPTRKVNGVLAAMLKADNVLRFRNSFRWN